MASEKNALAGELKVETEGVPLRDVEDGESVERGEADQPIPPDE
jgi:hypothetical protein